MGVIVRWLHLASHQIEHLLLRIAARGAGGLDEHLHTRAASVEKIAVILDYGERSEHLGQGGIGTAFGNQTLPGENLPKSRQRLQHARFFGADVHVPHLIHGRGRIQVHDDGLLGQARHFREHRVLRGEELIVFQQPVHHGRGEGLQATAVHVAEHHVHLERIVLYGLARQREQGFQHVVGLFPTRRRLGEFAVVLAMRMRNEQVLPNGHAPRHMRSAVRLQTQPIRQQHHVGVGAKDGPRRARARHASANCRIEALHARRIGEVGRGGCALDAHQTIEVGGEPAIVAGDQLFKERGTLVGRHAGKLLPGGVGPRDDGLAIPDLEHGAVKIQHVGEGANAAGRHGLLELFGRFAIQLGQAQIQAAERRVFQKQVNERLVLGVLFARRKPIFGAIKHRHLRRRVVVDEGLIGAQGQFEIGEREARVDGEKGAGGIDGFEDDVTAAATAHAIAQHLQQFGRDRALARLHFHDLVGAG